MFLNQCSGGFLFKSARRCVMKETERSKMSYVDKCSWCTTPYTVRRGRRPRRRWSRRTASCCCTTYTPSCCCWCTRCRWISWHTVSGTAWHCGWLRNIFKKIMIKALQRFSARRSQWESNLLWERKHI